MEIDLKTILKKYNIKQKELAAILNVSPGAISLYVNNSRNISLDKIIKLAKHLNVPMENLVTNNETISMLKSDYDEIRLCQETINKILDKYN